MTFSIVARCPDTGQLGVGAVTAMMAVGKLVAHARARVGAAATQAMVNPYLAFDGLALMADGVPPEEVLDSVIRDDPGRDLRQLALIDADGRTAAWSGEDTPAWSGHLCGQDFCTQGNRLVGPETLEAVADAFGKRDDLDLAHRILHALEAGESTGADKNGAVSATITVVDSEAYTLWDVRVDEAEDPVAELRRLAEQFGEQLLPQIKKLPTREDPLGEAAREDVEGIG